MTPVENWPVDDGPAINALPLAAAFERERGHLRGVAYRLLGSLSDAEDVVQEAWLRLERVDAGEIDDLRAWLTVVVSRLCLDQLRSARARREGYIGPWLPEPLVRWPGAAAFDGSVGGGGDGYAGTDAAGGQPDPADRVTLAESVSMAMMVVLEALSPAERTAFILHDVFDYDFAEIAAATGRTQAAARQLASRARRHVRDRSVRFEPDPGLRRQVAEAFLAAAAGGDLAGLTALLDPDVVVRSDGGGLARAARRPVTGADRAARFLIGIIEKGLREAGPDAWTRAVDVNGEPGFACHDGHKLRTIASLHVVAGRITEVNIVVNPEKLRHLSRGGADPGGSGGRW
ncbi:ECF RNA polymerase sigma factor SigJ [Frankia sp. AiPs1]|uniref:RNA polymerase sigma factor SigJ n=1 Tax=Frankia sp. AiPa1 TaxID=573492 RepID=UPI00202B1D99|nr:RNA polymerase sigma factor SigJ [Frankia sp. AiPa1]MCL9758078.1 RNA polymerase sigma factor SigJ [Frankia sp. AiPa1]